MLMDRIRSVGTHKRKTNPIGKEYNAPTMIPLMRIQILPGVAVYDEPDWLVTADGAPVPVTAAGSWGQLYAAGRM